MASLIENAVAAVSAAEKAYQFCAGSYTYDALLQSRKVYVAIRDENEEKDRTKKK